MARNIFKCDNIIYDNIIFDNTIDIEEFKINIKKLTVCEFYLFILLNENKIIDKYNYDNYIELIDYYLDIFYENNEDKTNSYNLKLYLIDILTLFDNKLIKKQDFNKKINNYYNSPSSNNELMQLFDKNILDNEYLSLYWRKLDKHQKMIDDYLIDKFWNKSNVERFENNVLNNSIFEMVIKNFNDNNYNQMKYYLNILIEKNYLDAILFMALFCKYFEKNKIDEEKYYLKIHNIINDGIENCDCEKTDELSIYIESMYFLSIYYLENDEFDKCRYVSLEIIKFIEFQNMIEYINNELSDYNDNGFLISNKYFNLNLSLFYIYFKIYDNLINNCGFYDGNRYKQKYKNEIEYIINNWKY